MFKISRITEMLVHTNSIHSTVFCPHGLSRKWTAKDNDVLSQVVGANA